MRTARFEEFRDVVARAEATRSSHAARGADHRMQASTADLLFTLRVGLAAGAVELGLVAYALLGGVAGVG